MSGLLAVMRLGAIRMGATPCWPQVGSSVWVCLQQHLTAEVSDAGVNISVNGKEKKSYGATKLSGQISGVSIFETPLELAQGDTINFRSATHNPRIVGATVSLLIELDL